MSTESISELSIEETNALRAKLGLAPLRERTTSSSVIHTQEEQVKARIQASKSRRATNSHLNADEDDDDEDGNIRLDEERLAQVQEGAVMVMDDVDVLEDTTSNKKSGVELVLPGEKSSKSNEDNADLEVEQKAIEDKRRQKTNKRDFVAALARSDEPLHNDQTEDVKPIEGAKLFESDLKPYEEPETSDRKKKKQKRDLGSAPEQVKIVRRQVHRGVIAGADEEDEGARRATVQVAPRAYGVTGSSSHLVEEDEEDELEASLARARKANLSQIQSATIKDLVLLASRANGVHEGAANDDFEVYVPASDFARIIVGSDSSPSISAAMPVAPESDTVQVKAEPQSEMTLGVSSSSSSAIPQPQAAAVSMEIEKPQVADLKEKTHRRGLASTLAVLKESGEGKTKDEVIVGRARDARPIADLNKPEDIVKLEYRDDHGRLLTQKEAYRQLKYQFRGEGPGAKKREKRERQLQREQVARSGAGPAGTTAEPGVKDLLHGVKKDHIVLWKN